jgi:hypothetical protein
MLLERIFRDVGVKVMMDNCLVGYCCEKSVGYCREICKENDGVGFPEMRDDLEEEQSYVLISDRYLSADSTLSHGQK